MKQNLKEKYKSIITFLTNIGIVILLSLSSYFIFVKFDLTQDKRFTLTPKTIELLQELDDVAQFKVYLEGDQLPAGFVKLKNSVEEILTEFSSYSDETIEFEFINLQDISSKTRREKEIARLAELGIPYLPFQENKEGGNTKGFYVTPGVEVFYKGKSVGTNLLETNSSNYNDNFKSSIENLEYKLSNALRKLKREKAKNVAFLQLHGESGQLELKDIAQTLAEYYTIGPIFLQNQQGQFDLNALNLIDILVIAGPKSEFNELELLIIDQFVMRGGKALFLLDGIQAEIDSLRTSPFFPAMPYNSGLEKLLFSYGIRINNDLVEDQQCTQIPIQTGPAGSSAKPELFPWVYFPLIFSENKHIITKNLDPIKLEFASTLNSVSKPNTTSTSLLNTSGLNRYRNTPTRIGFEEAVGGLKDENFNDKAKSVAMLTEGKFESYFKNRILPEAFTKNKTLISSVDSNQIIVISSGTFANNILLSDDKTLPLGADRYNPQSFYDNKRFLLNCINYLSGDESLIDVRSKRIEMRLLDKNKVKNEEYFIKVLNTVLPPAIVLIIAIIFFIVRKRKYAN